MTNPLGTSDNNSYTDKVPCYERPNDDEGGASEGLHAESSGLEAPAEDLLVEVPSLVEDVAEVGPSGVQPQVVVQQTACGDDSPELCWYEKLREKNIRERNEAMKETREEIEEAKQDMRDNAPGAKRAAVEVAGGMMKRKKVESVVEVRRTGTEEGGGRSRKRGRNMGGGRSKSFSKTPTKSGRGTTTSKLNPPPTLSSSSRILRPRKPVDYSEVPEPESDVFIWCFTCSKQEFNGCEKHVPYFGDNKEFKLEVEKSSVGRKAGDGVVNRGKVIPKGVLFGPYLGKFFTAHEYEKIQKNNMESGNAWEIRDRYNKKTAGYIDPGVNPDPQLHWLAKINCPNKTLEQNLVGFQLAGQIYYRATMDIPRGKELLVWYGPTYAEEIGIELDTLDKYTGDEDHTKEAIKCEYCGTGMEGEKVLEEHLGKGDGTMYRCGKKQAMEMVRMAKSGERKFVCDVCGKGFKTKCQLTTHGIVHSKVKVKCDVEGCSKSFAGASGLSYHKKAVHKGVFHECPECGKRFGDKSNMSRHFKNVHEEENPFKCAKCGLQFGENSNLRVHIKTVHEKIRAFKCDQCGKSFGRANDRKKHIEGVHYNIRYPCTWQDCPWTTNSKNQVKYHIRRAHTKEWSLECKLCEDQLDIWWGCIHPKEMNNHKVKKHPVEWKEQQEAYVRDHPFICKFKRCLNRYKTKVEKDRHEKKLH